MTKKITLFLLLLIAQRSSGMQLDEWNRNIIDSSLFMLEEMNELKKGLLDAYPAFSIDFLKNDLLNMLSACKRMIDLSEELDAAWQSLKKRSEALTYQQLEEEKENINKQYRELYTRLREAAKILQHILEGKDVWGFMLKRSVEHAPVPQAPKVPEVQQQSVPFEPRKLEIDASWGQTTQELIKKYDELINLIDYWRNKWVALGKITQERSRNCFSDELFKLRPILILMLEEAKTSLRQDVYKRYIDSLADAYKHLSQINIEYNEGKGGLPSLDHFDAVRNERIAIPMNNRKEYDKNSSLPSDWKNSFKQ